ncbi:type II secretion system protein [Ethanoligenens harbinense]|uniref:Prepilin-type N-terminal cleavage/methylation domain-containing protein n=1 Tax=Ethanoligenens harbinense (strain DSM 18485 / JCM 12961 / CGMCC 1.5033 / YUAN-3) TaxID=663278 RepID=E6U2Z6_ETHHY|nr:type II secretion system protein [Ethanoligenens harbinense]ADU26363.1 hypothetical protein Ethha_0794 [Ethanoligenens harbinense YUAN-3]AVQ95492.1 prepilin-type cleavage/methylation domain-containing protein [Ethanoligenens harbinense YUAN-3]AYF38156.1 prepilin-type cleavage/methylation domain-containing protein [Ethanoligenens harbinense]AYF40901.1 prepilin-type cleavage/methylation domain-containing protein [Ethanoligenens harbinense]QCN91733.1 prepilin-type cleavage/methylation domain-c
MVKALAETHGKLRRSKKGFTLIELLVVLAILTILVAILIPVVAGFIHKAKQSASNTDAHTVFTAAAAYVALHDDTTFTSLGSAASTGKVPITTADLSNYIGSNYSFTITKITINGGVVAGVQVSEFGGTFTGTYGTV